GTLAPYQERMREGVSANLCDALAELLEAARADALRASFSFAHRRPVAREVPRSVVLPADMAPTLRSAAAALREVGVLSSLELMGTVVVLESDDAAAGGAIQMHALVEGRPMRVRMSLPPAEYAVAMEAHRRRALVRCAGDLLREGRARVLQNPRDFVLSGEEEG
ncbi:MAG TPA: hypothetical protein PLA94_14625, partial [Myxococcota bacterium]|nr:hypothetical protein [Myxococcota bacterium]